MPVHVTDFPVVNVHVDELSSAFVSFAFPFGEGKRGGPRFKFNFYFLSGGSF